jgi:hypothetical protein
MTEAEKLLIKMCQNPAGDWTVADMERLYDGLGWHCLPPSGGGSHWKVTAPGDETILTIPARRPIKPNYIRKFLDMVSRHQMKGSGSGEED